MKYGINDAAKEIKRRSALLSEKRKLRKEIALNGALCCLSFAFIVAIMQRLRLFGPAELDGSVYGSFLLSKEAGGYILVGVICIVAAVAVTLYCVNQRKKREMKNGNDDEADGQ